MPISAFWTNTIWYLLLGAAAVAQLAWAVTKSKNRLETLAFFLTVLGATLFVEEFLLIFTKAYSYFPQIFSETNDIVSDDDIVGNYFSQISVSVSLVLVVTRGWKPLWYLIFAVLYGCVEELFLRLGIYLHHWYRTWITVLLLPVAFLTVRQMYRGLQAGLPPLRYYGYLAIGLFPSFTVSFWSAKLAGVQLFTGALLGDAVISRQVIGLALFLVMLVSLVWALLPRPALPRVMVVAPMLYIVYFLLYRTGLLWIAPGWYLPVATLEIGWAILLTLLLDRMYGQPLRQPG